MQQWQHPSCCVHVCSTATSPALRWYRFFGSCHWLPRKKVSCEEGPDLPHTGLLLQREHPSRLRSDVASALQVQRRNMQIRAVLRHFWFRNVLIRRLLVLSALPAGSQRSWTAWLVS